MLRQASPNRTESLEAWRSWDSAHKSHQPNLDDFANKYAMVGISNGSSAHIEEVVSVSHFSSGSTHFFLLKGDMLFRQTSISECSRQS